MRIAVPLVLALSLVACPGGTPTNPPTTTTPSSTTTGPGTGGSDAGVPPKAHVAVHVTDAAQQPIAGATVVVNDAAGAVVAGATADPTGAAAVDVPAGGAVVAYHAFGLDFVGVAVVDPPDGATARLVLHGPAVLPPASTPATAFTTKVTQIPAATHELSIYACWPTLETFYGFPAPLTATFSQTNASCTTYPSASFLAIAYDNQNVPIAWGGAFDQPTSPGGTQTVPVPLGHTSFDTLVASINSISKGVSLVRVSLSPQAAAASPIAYDLVQAGSGTTQSFATSFTVPQGIFQSYQVIERADLYGEMSGGPVESHVVRQRSYLHLPATTSFAVDALALVSVDALDVADAAHPVVAWSLADGARGDYAKVKLTWTNGTASHAFTAFLPPDHGAAFRMPDVPTELSAFAPSATGTFGKVMVEYTDEETATGYAASSAFQLVAPADGRGTVVSGGSNQSHAP